MKTVSNRLLQDWLQDIKNRGQNLKVLLNTSGIPSCCYENTRSRISGEQLARLNAEIRRLLNDQFLGYGPDVMSPALLERVMIKILAHARNLKEILFEWENFWNVVQQGTGVTSVDVSNNEILYRFKFRTPQRPGTYVWILDSTMLKLQLFSWMIGKQIKPKVIGIAEYAPSGVNDDLLLLPARVLFNQPYNFLTFDKDYLHCPVVRTPDQCLSYKKHLPIDFFAVPGDERTFVALVERAMKDLLHTECRLPQIQHVAEELSVSVRGLRRQLEAESEGFKNLKRKIRLDLAVHKLASSEVPIGDSAVDLGFSGTAAFSRAFKAWTTSTPQDYRSRRGAPYHPN
jgi:AraC-like DNA-binding protein